jgi:serine protease inhibitor
MKHTLKIGVLIVCFWGWIVFGSAVSAETELNSDVKLQVNENNAFAWDLYGKLQEQEGNLFFSPYSISTALAMAYAGAQGTMATQMAKVLHFTLEPEALHSAFASLVEHFQEIQKKGDVALNVANALWIQQDVELLEEFLNIIKTYYGSNLFQVNFKEAIEVARIEINNWVAKATNDKIKELIAQGILDNLTRLVLTNAIYFKGNWQNPFQEELTHAEPFWFTAKKTIMVPMMHQTGSLYYGGDDLLQVLGLPYAGADLYMFILLPRKKDGLSEIEKRLCGKNVAIWMSTLEQQKVEVSLPKFTMTSDFELSKTLSALGMSTAFSGNADLSKISGTEPLHLSNVIHKAFIEVNEQGTEAAAATGVAVVADGYPEFKADHPFLFLIYDHFSGSLLFLGRVVNPTK